jgi:HD-like signal output (HDOD) protein/DNA-binding CsgD family transcriptional regulator
MQATVVSIDAQRASGTRLSASKRGRTPALIGARHMNEGRGRRLTAAFEALEAFPALEEPHTRLLAVLAKGRGGTAEMVSVIESDVSLVIAVLRLANAGRSNRERVDTVNSAVELLGAESVRGLAEGLSTYDFFERAGSWGSVAERFRLHARATQRAVDRIAYEVGYEHRDRLAVASLLHDIGKLVLIHAYPDYPTRVRFGAGTPEESIHQERGALGIDHALIAGVLLRRWGLPTSLVSSIERHHNPEAEGEAAFVRLADMLAHYERGARISASEMRQGAHALGFGSEGLRRIMHELPSGPPARQHPLEACPLSRRELSVLRSLAKGKVYKQIAVDLDLSVSAVRSHLHNMYGKLGVIDRAQAVLIAAKAGWI